ncbi:putative nucleotidyltransferase substrate binding domain-containing protein [Geodermatophilus maliterrae]|uniref:Nucleotidyltransferase substrate binding domain-containing protein n=1 Tax=Geodermatophilus maliterrae TaxID=3162531 RepID=A0ABV3XMB8_9ACTN
MRDVADFLRARPPFDALAAEDLDRVAGAAEVEFLRAGAVVVEQGEAPLEHLYVVRRGALDIVHDGRVLDELGPGELFGQASMLAGLPARFGVVAAEDTLCYRIPAAVARPVLARPEGLRFLARSLLADPVPRRLEVEPVVDAARRPVAGLLRARPVVCPPGTTVRDAARRMTEAGATAAVVAVRGSELGIVTDRDLRSRILARGASPDTPVEEVMTFPAYTVAADRMSGEVLLDMLDRGIRHLPVVSPGGRVLGVLEDADLLAAAPRSSFHLRSAIARARTVQDLVEASAQLRPAVLALHDARVAASDVTGIYSVVSDALTRRLVQLTVAGLGTPAVPFTWLALGSLARREAVPSSDVDSALVWYGSADEEMQAELRRVARAVVDGLEACGFPADTQGAVAAQPLFMRSYAGWREAAAGWLADPTQEKALVLVSLVVDGRPVWGIRSGPALPEVFRDARRHPLFLSLLARFALGHRPPTGFLRDFVVEHGGAHAGRLDLKHGGLQPIVDLARWAGMAAGVASASTPARLRAAADAGTLPADDARTLGEAFDLVLELRLDHQVEQLRAGERPDDHLDPAVLDPVTRGALREAFRAVADVQRRVTGQLRQGVL